MEVFLGVAMFTLVILALVAVILGAKKQLVASGPVSYTHLTLPTTPYV